MHDLQKWALCFVLSALAIVISYLWLDKPIAFFAHEMLRQFDVFSQLTRFPELSPPLAAIALLALGLRALTGRPLSKPYAVLLVCSISFIVSAAAKNQLKFVFGRTWPETWINNNPSLIRDGVYGFNPFHGGQAFASFPSGHMTEICVLMSILWLCYPKFRAPYFICVVAVAVGLVGANYHFLSDVIAGGFLGVSIGWVAVALWDAGGPARVSSRG